MNQFFARVVELREEKYAKYDGKFTVDSSARGFLEMTQKPFADDFTVSTKYHIYKEVYKWKN